jgi:DedD protein
MRSLLDLEEEEETTAREITLSTASLLGIFFGLVLICGVFFGFGYSMGRGTGQGAQAASLGNGPANSAAQSDASTAAANQPPAPAAPSQDNVQAPAKTPSPVVVKHDKGDDAEDASAEDAAAAPPKHVNQALVAATEVAAPTKPSARIVPAPAAVASTPAPVAAPAPGTGHPMVQIAAVARQEDADVLVSALRQRGYGVVVRSEPQDKLLHVQVGPFADRTQATAIKQKLLSDGYNAIIKQ